MVNKKGFVFLLVGLVVIVSFLYSVSLASATLEVTKEDKGSVIISELDNPAIFNFKINNLGGKDYFEIYNLLGISMAPKGTFALNPGANDVEVKVYPNDDIRKKEGFYSFEYQIRSSGGEIFKDTLRIKIVPLKSAFQITTKPLPQNSDEALVTLKNIENTNLENVKVHLSSVFFENDQVVSLGPYDSQTLHVPINKEDAKKLLAGQYVITAGLEYNKAQTKISGLINYLEKEGTSVVREDEGYIVQTTKITKTNEGNVQTKATIELRKDILSRLVTVYSVEPSNVERDGVFVYYKWDKELAPTESMVITSTTNYTFPFILIVLIVLITLFVKSYARTGLSVDKRVSFVKTKGGEFALKVRLHIRARKHVDGIQIIDSLPGMAKLYEKFGTAPHRIDSATRRVFWNIDRLNIGEERVFSYIIYSKVAVTGRFELPAATAVYQMEGKTHEVISNRTYFVAESGATGIEE